MSHPLPDHIIDARIAENHTDDDDARHYFDLGADHTKSQALSRLAKASRELFTDLADKGRINLDDVDAAMMNAVKTLLPDSSTDGTNIPLTLPSEGDPREDTRPWKPGTLAVLRPGDQARWTGAYGITCEGVVETPLTKSEYGTRVAPRIVGGGEIKGRDLHYIPGPPQQIAFPEDGNSLSDVTVSPADGGTVHASLAMIHGDVVVGLWSKGERAGDGGVIGARAFPLSQIVAATLPDGTRVRQGDYGQDGLPHLVSVDDRDPQEDQA